MVKKGISLIMLAFIVPKLFGQIGGRHTYQFLNLMTSPRQAALGGKTITIWDQDVNQALYNPATINEEMDNHLAVNYGNLYGEIKYGTAAYAYTWDKHVQTFHAGVNYVSYGDFEGYDELGNKTNSFTGSEAALSLGYAYNIPWTSVYLGTNLKLISSTLESYHSFGVAADVGAIYIDEKNDINIALVVRNFGTQITTYSGVQEKLPLEVIAGISQELEHLPLRWHITLENLQNWNLAFNNPNQSETQIDGEVKQEKISILKEALRHLILGAELFPNKGFNIRVSYNFRRGEELRIMDQRNFSGLAAGFGIRFNKIKFDYSYSRFTVGANTNLFGLTINLQ